MENKKALLMELFKNDEDLFNSTIEELDSYNGYLGDDRYYEMDMLPELLSGTNIIDLLNMAYFGNDENYCVDNYGCKRYESFNPNREYFYFNGYGNLCSTNYKDYSAHLDDYFIDAIIENQNHLYLDDEVKNILED